MDYKKKYDELIKEMMQVTNNYERMHELYENANTQAVLHKEITRDFIKVFIKNKATMSAEFKNDVVPILIKIKN
jgi:hypothetical protein